MCRILIRIKRLVDNGVKITQVTHTKMVCMASVPVFIPIFARPECGKMNEFEQERLLRRLT